MTPAKKLKARNFRSAKQELPPQDPSPYSGPDSAYSLAFTDKEFLLREEMRAVRMQLELLKPELIQQEEGITSTVVIFGSARIPEPEQAKAALAKAQQSGHTTDLAKAERDVRNARYYEEARKFARLVTLESRRYGEPITVVTGGGPGVMEAGNLGAFESGGPTIGLNIVLPHEQAPNPYITPSLCFNFHYFALRKMHFLMRAVALVCFPGGFGTLDELFEVLTLIQTKKSRARPILLFGESFWRSVLNFDALVEHGMISPEDVHLFRFVESAEDAWAHLVKEFELDLPSLDNDDLSQDM